MAGVDPSLWSVDQVIDQLCSWESSLYKDQLPQIKQNFNLEILTSAIRDNDIDGDALLALEDANLKNDLGFTSFGQRRELARIVKHLQEISDIFKQTQSKAPKRRIESDDEQEPERRTPESQPETKKRRIQPELLSANPIFTPEDLDTDDLNDEELAFLNRHRQPSDVESLRPYDESDAEVEIGSDDSLYGDLDSDDDTSPLPQLSSEEVYRAVDESIEEYRQSWKTNKQPKKHKSAYRRWISAAKARTRKPQQNALQNEIRTLQVRLDKFRKGIHDMSRESHKIEDIKHTCQNLQVTVEAIAEREYFLEVLESDVAPPKPDDIPAAIQTNPEDLAEDEEILESESELEDDDEEADVFLDDESASGSDVSLTYDPADSDWNPQLPPDPVLEKVFQFHASPTPTHSPPSTLPDPLPARSVTTPRQMTPSFEDFMAPFSYPQLPTPKLVQSSSPLLAAPKTRQETPNLLEVVQNSIEDQMDEESEIELFEERLPRSRYGAQGTTIANAIELGSSPTNSEYSMTNSVHTPPLNPETPTKYVEPQRPQLPRFPHIQETRVMKYKDIGNDAFLLLCKSVYKRSRDVAEDVLDKIEQLNPKQVASALGAIISEWQDSVGGDESLDGGEEDVDIVWTYFYIVFASGSHARQVEDISEEALDVAFNSISSKAAKFDKILRSLLRWYIDTQTNPGGNQDKGTPPAQQSQWTRQTNGGFDDHSASNHTFVGGSRKSPTPLTDTESDLDMAPSTSQKRKRHVQQSQEALRRQKDDRDRVEAEEEQRRRLMMQRFQAFTGNENVAAVPVNFVDPIVYLDKHIARRVKPHQIEGIQFIWRELIADPNHQGCLLAHTMGLGKTMQVVSFLVTLAQTNQNPQLRYRIPPHLRSKKVLIICPASLVDNWFDEIMMWTPPGPPGSPLLGPVFRISGSRKHKIATVEAWNQNPGVLIVGYESLKALLKKQRTTAEEDTAFLEKSLLQDPCVVIADEAHKLKNTKSAVNQVASQMATTSRIALTGSPLNNHLEEYHTMINWIAPNYLGTLTQFKAKYSEPIERGLYADSSRYDKRKSLEKLYVLKRDLAPKIHRKDISAIAKDMPQKTEFFITVPLTEVQNKIYTTMVQYILRAVGSSSGSAIKSTNAQLWAWLSILSWLCNHPSCLIRKLEEKNPEEAEAVNASLSNLQTLPDDQFDENKVSDNFTVTGSPLSDLLPTFLSYFAEANRFDDRQDPELSTRSVVTRHLIQESVAQKDKILIFSHSIPTLDFLQDMVVSMGLECMRIDGSTKTDQRQDATKYFNDQNSNISVFLISTRAGGLGLNLQGANRVIIYDFGFNPSWEEQAIGRAYRLGQKKPVFVYRFRAGGTFEETMYNKAIFKTQLFSRVVDQKNVIRHASKKIEDYLFVPKEAEKQDLTECLGKDALLDKIIERIPDAICGLILTETFQREDEDDEMTPEERKAAEEAYDMEQLLRKDPVRYTQTLAAKERAQREERAQAQHALLTLGGQRTTFEQTWNTNTINAAGPTPRPTQPAIEQGLQVLEALDTNGTNSIEGSVAPGCRNQ